jgi:hypothetical protein
VPSLVERSSFISLLTGSGTEAGQQIGLTANRRPPRYFTRGVVDLIRVFSLLPPLIPPLPPKTGQFTILSPKKQTFSKKRERLFYVIWWYEAMIIPDSPIQL